MSLVRDLLEKCCTIGSQLGNVLDKDELLFLVRQSVRIHVHLLQENQEMILKLEVAASVPHISYLVQVADELQASLALCQSYLKEKTRMSSSLQRFFLAQNKRNEFTAQLQKLRRLQQRSLELFPEYVGPRALCSDPEVDTAIALTLIRCGAAVALFHDAQAEALADLLAMPGDRQEKTVRELLIGAEDKVDEVLAELCEARKIAGEPQCAVVRDRLPTAYTRIEDPLPEDRVTIDFTRPIRANGDAFEATLLERGLRSLRVTAVVLAVSPEDWAHSGRELAAMRQTSNLSHRHVAKLFGWVPIPYGGARRVALIWEQCGASLFVAKAHSYFHRLQDRVVILSQIASALVALAGRGLTHGGLGPESVLLRCESSPDAVLVDYGLGAALAAARGCESPGGTTPSGDPHTAPELQDEKGRVFNPSEVFSFGVLAAIVLCGQEAVDLARAGETVSDKTLRALYAARGWSGGQGRDVGGVERHALEMLSQCCLLDPLLRPRWSDLEAAVSKLVLVEATDQGQEEPPFGGTQYSIQTVNKPHRVQQDVQGEAHLFTCTEGSSAVGGAPVPEGHSFETVEQVKALQEEVAELRQLLATATEAAHISAVEFAEHRRLVQEQQLEAAEQVRGLREEVTALVRTMQEQRLEATKEMQTLRTEVMSGAAAFCEGVRAEQGRLMQEQLVCLQASLPKRDVTQRDRDELSEAAKTGQMIRLRTLLSSVAFNFSASSQDGVTSLHLAAGAGHLEATRLLLDFGVAVDASTTRGGIVFGGARENTGPTALIAAAQGGHAEVVRLLLSRGASVAVQDLVRSSVLNLASSSGNAEVVRMLLDRGAVINAKDRCGSTALHRAAQGGHVEVARRLLDRGVDIKETDAFGASSLHVAMRNGHLEVTKLLLERGAVVSQRTAEGSTTLHCAALGGCVDLARLLLDRGIAADVLTQDGRTVLHLAAQGGHTNMARMLLDHGVQLNASTQNGRTAVHFAALGGHVETVRLLRERGADFEARDQDGKTGRDLAQLHGHQAAAALL